ncbi:VWA domain-containing protein [Deinococcus sp. KSM4-11]|uniref:vWA domain-containing protein n=1 Tax=Deinococcus sp. KSM4-11 TaxID=2568654 RepID=UPI0010A3A67D|nr:VWA domain-containing protein [Deinococcus sp. KSM4-11]THF87206.1 VWA domain-containing protein [Deinococcus sp. KSM4-11]
MHESNTPSIELLPLKTSLPAGQDSELTLLVRIHPAAAPVTSARRPPLNLSFVLDRSGSMSGTPIAMARTAIQVALRLMQPHDRVSVVAFDDRVETVVPSQLATDPEALCRAVAGITDRGSTALHAGWLEGAMLIAQHLDPQALNRVLLLSDGQANQGETRADVIAQHVKGLTARGVSTSTIGLGHDYDEALLQGMADAGDGNYEHIEHDDALPAFFAAELQGLTRTTGHTVSLGVEPNPALGSLRSDVLNDLPRNDLGRWQLANLIDGRPLDVVVTLHVPAQPQGTTVGVTRLRLAWTDRQGVRQKLRAQLTLPVVDPAAYVQLPEDIQVTVAAERLRAARVREEAVAHAVAGNVPMSREVLSREHRRLSRLAMPELASEVHGLVSLDRDFAEDEVIARKRATSQSYNTRRSKSEN